MDDAVRKLCETYTAWFGLGNEVEDAAGARFVCQPEAPRIFDANLVSDVTAASAEEVAAVLDEADARYAGLRHRQFVLDPRTPPALPAALSLAGYTPDPTLQMLLEGPLQGPPPPDVELHPVETEADWTALRGLVRLDHEEACRKEGREVYDQVVTDQMVRVMQLRPPSVRLLLARADGRDVAYFSGWPGRNGTGIVEDLFTHPDYRRRGIARALIHACVAWAREGGADAVLIGARPNDTPKHAYEAMGFRPTCVTWGWMRNDAR